MDRLNLIEDNKLKLYYHFLLDTTSFHESKLITNLFNKMY